MIAFRIHKLNEVGMLQPAGVTLYEYNSPGILINTQKKEMYGGEIHINIISAKNMTIQATISVI